MEVHHGHDGRDAQIVRRAGKKGTLAYVPVAVAVAVLAAILVFWMRWIYLVVRSWFFR